MTDYATDILRKKLREPRVRTEQQLRDTVALLCQFLWNRRIPTGATLWSIPVNEERDFDCILSDGINELVYLREGAADAEREISSLRQALAALKRGDCWCEVGVGRPMAADHSKACVEARRLSEHMERGEQHEAREE